MNRIEEIRTEIDRIDSQLVDLFEERFALSREVADFKIETGQKVLDKEREKQKIKSIEMMITDLEDKQIVGEVFRQLMDLSRKVQYGLIVDKQPEPIDFEMYDDIEKDKVRVVYQGVPGAYSQEAMFQYFGKGVNNFHVNLWREAMEAVRMGEADYAVLPIENSSAGIVSEVYDLLVDYGFYIIEEVNISVSHALLGVKGATLEDIKQVYSHPQALAQCGKFLRTYPEWECIEWNNTAASAKMVKETGDKSKAAIGSPLTADIYGLEVLKEKVNASDINTTRFVVVGKERKCKKGARKIMVSFELPHESGSLYRMLSHFIFNKLNMTKIESRPIPERKWEYRFFVEFEGNIEEHNTKTALKGISEESLMIKIMGNY